jgi:hypothetical protein
LASAPRSPGLKIPGTPFGDAASAYSSAESLSGINEGTDSLGAGGLSSLAPGVYSFSSSTVLLSGLLQLNAEGSNTGNWIFQIPFALTIQSASSVEVVNTGGNGAFGGSITWVVGSDATLGTSTTFLGTIISQAGDQVLTDATIGCGRVVSLDASVTLDSDIVEANCAVSGGGQRPSRASGTGHICPAFIRTTGDVPCIVRSVLPFRHRNRHSSRAGRGCGASHQTGWTALIARCLKDQLSGANATNLRSRT